MNSIAKVVVVDEKVDKNRQQEKANYKQEEELTNKTFEIFDCLFNFATKVYRQVSAWFNFQTQQFELKVLYRISFR